MNKVRDNPVIKPELDRYQLLLFNCYERAAEKVNFLLQIPALTQALFYGVSQSELDLKPEFVKLLYNLRKMQLDWIYSSKRCCSNGIELEGFHLLDGNMLEYSEAMSKVICQGDMTVDEEGLSGMTGMSYRNIGTPSLDTSDQKETIEAEAMLPEADSLSNASSPRHDSNSHPDMEIEQEGSIFGPSFSKTKIWNVKQMKEADAYGIETTRNDIANHKSIPKGSVKNDHNDLKRQELQKQRPRVIKFQDDATTVTTSEDGNNTWRSSSDFTETEDSFEEIQQSSTSDAATMQVEIENLLQLLAVSSEGSTIDLKGSLPLPEIGSIQLGQPPSKQCNTSFNNFDIDSHTNESDSGSLENEAETFQTALNQTNQNLELDKSNSRESEIMDVNLENWTLGQDSDPNCVKLTVEQCRCCLKCLQKSSEVKKLYSEIFRQLIRLTSRNRYAQRNLNVTERKLDVTQRNLDVTQRDLGVTQRNLDVTQQTGEQSLAFLVSNGLKLFQENLLQLKELLQSRLLNSHMEDASHFKDLRKSWEIEKLNREVLTHLKAKQNKNHTKWNQRMKSIESEILNCRNEMESVRNGSYEEVKRLIKNELLYGLETRKRIALEIGNLLQDGGKATSRMMENREKLITHEQENSLEIHTLEESLHNFLGSYDSVMSDKQNELDILIQTCKNNVNKISNLEKRFSDTEELYEEMRITKRLQELLRNMEMADNFKRNRAARIIQGAWKRYRLRKLRRLRRKAKLKRKPRIPGQLKPNKVKEQSADRLSSEPSSNLQPKSHSCSKR